jgi:hypothetical protein
MRPTPAPRTRHRPGGRAAPRTLATTLATILAPTLVATLASALTPPLVAPLGAQLRAGFRSTLVARGDDTWSGFRSFGFGANVRGETYSSASACTNGYLTLFLADDPLSCRFGAPPATLADFATINGTAVVGLFRDMDARNAASGQLGFGGGTVDGRSAFGFTWDGVFSFGSTTNRNFLQLVLVERSDRAPGDFDLEYNFGPSLFPGPFGAVAGVADDGGFSGAPYTAAVVAAPSTRTVQCWVRGSVDNAACGAATVVPEPAALALLATGLGALATLSLVRRRLA